MELLRQNSMAWLERTNPLRGLSISRAGAIFDNARVWGSPRLQYMYNEIEATDPVLMTCVERRNAALAGLQQQFVTIAGTDETLADEQRDALARFANGIDNFGDTLERMDEAFFRGYCHVQPIWDGATVPHVNFLNSWNFMRDDAGRWLWNPKCNETIAGLDDVRGARLVSLVRRRAIDYPAIFIYIRKALGERDYGRFIERHGIPHAAIMMAPGTEKKDVPAYLAAADAWNNGQNMVLPNGATTDLATEARGTDPFTPFVEHQDKYIVLLATGGTLTSLAQADTGSLAGGAQMEVWREIVARDGVLIADALNRGLFRRYIEMAFPGRPVCAEFRLDNEKKASAAEVADLVGKLKVAGYTVDQAQLEEAVGFKLTKEDGGQGLTALPSMVGRGVPSEPFMNKDLNGRSTEIKSTQQNDSGREGDVLTAFSKDNGPAAEAVKKLLENPTPESAAALLKDLPNLLPEDPALASVIAEEMAKQFAVTRGRVTLPSAPQPNKDDAKGVSHSDADGKFDGGNGGSASPKSDKAKAKAEKHEWQSKATQQAAEKMAVVKGGSDCPDFMPGVTISGGKKFDHIAFYQEDFKHIQGHVQGDFGGGKAGYNHQAMLEGSKMSHAITHGTWYAHHGDYVAVDGKDKAVVLSPDGRGLKITSTYESSDKVNEIRTGNFQRVFNKEVADDESHSTSAGV